MRGVTIRNKLILAYLVPTITLVLGGSLLVYREARLLLEAELGRRLTSLAEATVGGLPANDPRRLSALTAEDTTTQQRLRDKLEAVRATTGVRRIFIFDRSFASLVDTRAEVRFGDPVFEVLNDRAEVERVFKAPGQSASSVMFSGVDGVLYKNGYAPIRYDGQVVAALGVEGSAEFFGAIAEFRYALGALLLIGLALIVLVSSLLARTLTQPIGALVDASRKLGRGDMSDDIILARDDEFRTLADAFNEMRRDLLDRDQQMQMMLHGIAHEVRNPLGGMELFCGLLAEDLTPGTQESQYVGKIRKELDYLTRVVNDFLAFARNQPLDWSRFPARDLLSDLVGLLAWDLQARGVTLDFRLDDPDLELTADRERLRQMLINLIRNAGQATASGGRVTVWARTLRAPSLDHLPELRALDGAWIQPPERLEGFDGWRVIAVQDTGKGIPASGLESIFKPFYTTKQKGSGLGLALTGKIVAEHGGGLAVASTVRPDRTAGDDGVAPALMAALNTPENAPNAPQHAASAVGGDDDAMSWLTDDDGSASEVSGLLSDEGDQGAASASSSADKSASWLSNSTMLGDDEASEVRADQASADDSDTMDWDDDDVPDDGIWDFSKMMAPSDDPAPASEPQEALLGEGEAMLGADEGMLGADAAMLGGDEAMLGAEEPLLGGEAMLGADDAWLGGEGMLGGEEAMLGASAESLGEGEAMLGAEEPMLGGEGPMLGDDEASASGDGEEALLGEGAEESAAVLGAVEASVAGEDGEEATWGTVMVIMLPFCDAIESQEVEVPDGWLG